MTTHKTFATHSAVVEISERAFALGVASTLYDQCRQQEQRIIREMTRVQEQLTKCQHDRQFYGRLIGME